MINSIQIHCGFNESASNEAHYQIDTRFPSNQANDHRTGILALPRIEVMYSMRGNFVAYTLLTIKQVPLPLLRENP